MTERIRDKIRHQAVNWLTGEHGYKLLYSLARIKDTLLENALLGVSHRYPGYVDAQSLARIGEEAGLTRSPFHTNSEYASRLETRILLNQQKGSAETLIREIVRFFGEAGQWNAVMTIYGSGERLSMQRNDDEIYKDQTSFTAAGWAWCTVVIVRDELLTGQEASALQALCREFKAAHIKGQCGVLTETNIAEFYSEVPQLPAPMDPVSAYGIGGLHSEAGEYHSSLDPVIFTF